MQHVNGKAPLLISIDEELHDVRRVLKNGEEDDLRGALDMMIRRVEEMRGLIVERKEKEKEVVAAKQREIESLRHQLSEKDVELGVTRSNLRMVSANNEMLEEALRGGGGGGLGWGHKRGESAESSQSTQQPAPPQNENSRFFTKFRFSSRPGTPSSPNTSAHASKSPSLQHAASTPNLLLSSDEESSSEKAAIREQERLAAKQENEKRVKDLREALEKEKSARTALEAELESLSQALFEEANKMVSTERRKRAETEEELREAQEEREALRSALRVVEGENPAILQLINTCNKEQALFKKLQDVDDISPSTAVPLAFPVTFILAITIAFFVFVQASLESVTSSGSESGYAAASEDNDDLVSPPQATPPVMHHRIDLEEELSPWADLPGSPPPTMRITAM
ncbi:hypothetical protein BDZ89DRAFT_1108093 [Hymenopellis radicata]|nr:hypothetical protein BDZ89DRAFT_1108093 [Hymenopellis radicata]